MNLRIFHPVGSRMRCTESTCSIKWKWYEWKEARDEKDEKDSTRVKSREKDITDFPCQMGTLPKVFFLLRDE